MQRYEEAVAAHAFKGSRPPDEWADIDTELGAVRHHIRVALSPKTIDKAAALVSELHDLFKSDI